MQKVENKNSPEKITYSKKEKKVVENFGVIGIKQNGCWTSSASTVELANEINLKLDEKAKPCVCNPGTEWMSISDPNDDKAQKVYGCALVPPSADDDEEEVVVQESTQ